MHPCPLDSTHVTPRGARPSPPLHLTSSMMTSGHICCCIRQGFFSAAECRCAVYTGPFLYGIPWAHAPSLLSQGCRGTRRDSRTLDVTKRSEAAVWGHGGRPVLLGDGLAVPPDVLLHTDAPQRAGAARGYVAAGLSCPGLPGWCQWGSIRVSVESCCPPGVSETQDREARKRASSVRAGLRLGLRGAGGARPPQEQHPEEELVHGAGSGQGPQTGWVGEALQEVGAVWMRPGRAVSGLPCPSSGE